MIKNKFNTKLRDLARSLSPQKDERTLVEDIYESLNTLFGKDNCIQIGSYPRFTSITPIHDLDVLFLLGPWSDADHDPSLALDSLYGLIDEDYKNPTQYEVKVFLQTHSVMISFVRKDNPFSIDIVPAFSYGINEFKQDKYKVPQVTIENDHHKREGVLWNPNNDNAWITSDPRGYMEVATITGNNPDFRKTVKIIKKWKHNLKRIDENLKLKSFHLEQVITKMFIDNPTLDIFDAIFNFFIDLPSVIECPNQIPDRANLEKYIDDYLINLTDDQKNIMRQARDGFLIKLETLEEDAPTEDILEIYFRERKSQKESYLFDQKTPALIENKITISGWIQKNGENYKRLDQAGIVYVGNSINFQIEMGVVADLYKWKVKNSDLCVEPRGEISDYQTLQNPESTKYPGNHYVQCFAIKNNVCIATAIQNVWIKNNYHGEH